jgi:hypothetical protein
MDACSDLQHDARPLVTEYDRELDRDRAISFEYPQIGVAQPGRHGLNEHFSRARRIEVYVRHDEGLARVERDGCCRFDRHVLYSFLFAGLHHMQHARGQDATGGAVFGKKSSYPDSDQPIQAEPSQYNMGNPDRGLASAVRLIAMHQEGGT